MKRLKAVFTQPFPNSLYALPGGPLLVAACYSLTGIFVNASLLYSLVTGNILRARRAEALEARESAPVLYWCYIAGLGVVALFFDFLFVYGLWQHMKKRPNKSPEPTR
jgi:hypothetical protein